MKLPQISTGPVQRKQGVDPGAYRERSQAAAGLMQSLGAVTVEIHNRRVESAYTKAQGDASVQLSELEAKLKNTRVIPVEEIPDDIEYSATTLIVDENGNTENVESPIAFTHEIANEWWAKKSSEIIEEHANSIPSARARERYIAEMSERYAAPGASQISAASIAKQQAYSQANTMMANQQIMASSASSEDREAQAKENLARAVLTGADPTWAAQQAMAIGPRIDQIDYQKKVVAASSEEELNDLEAELWSDGGRMSPDQRRAVASDISRKQGDIDEVRRERHAEGEQKYTSFYIQQQLTPGMLSRAIANDEISGPTGRTLFNALQVGSSTETSNKVALDNFRKRIVGLPYLEGDVEVNAELLRREIQMNIMGLSAQGAPLPGGALISGKDAQAALIEIDKAVDRTVKSPQFKDALDLVKAHTGVSVDPITGAFTGNLGNKQAYIAMKQALTGYMTQAGVEAKPVDWFNANRANFTPEIFSQKAEDSFVARFPEAKSFINDDGQLDRNRFILALQKAISTGKISEERGESIYAAYTATFENQGISEF